MKLKNALEEDNYVIRKENTSENVDGFTYEIRFKDFEFEHIGEMLSTYSVYKKWLNDFLNRCFQLSEIKDDKFLLENDYKYIYPKYTKEEYLNDYDNEEEPFFGEIIIISSPEYYMHVYYREVDDKVILYSPFHSVKGAKIYGYDNFIYLLKWWKTKLIQLEYLNAE